MKNDNNLVNNPNQGNNGNVSPIIPQNVQGNIQNNPAQNNNVVDNFSADDGTDYSPAVNVPGLDELEDYVDETVANNGVDSNSNIQNANLNSNSFNSNTTVDMVQNNVSINPNVQEQPQINMAEVDDSFDNGSKNFSPNIDMSGLISGEQPMENEEIFNPSMELGVDANVFDNPNSQIQANTADYGFDPFNKFDEATEENFLPGFDQNFYNPDYDDSQAFMPGIVPEEEAPVVDNTNFFPNENNIISNSVNNVENNPTVVPTQPVQNPMPVQPVNDFVAPVQPVQNPAPVQPANDFVAPAQPVQNPAPVQPANDFVAPAQPVQNPMPVQPANDFVAPAQPVQNPMPVQPANDFVAPAQPVQNPMPVQPANDFVAPAQPVQNPAPIQPVNDFVAPVQPVQNSIPVQPEPVVEQPIIENNQPQPSVNLFEMTNNNLVSTIDSLDDYSSSMNNEIQQFNTASENAGKVIGSTNYSSSYTNNSAPEYIPAPTGTVSSIKPKVNYSMSNFNSLLTPDKKVVTFIGTSKNGTSFLVNNVAAIFSSLGINTAILDMTHNKNSYYIYTKNDENLRKISYTSIEKLKVGECDGIKVNKNLTVYTALPNDGKDYSDCEGILTTLAQNHSVVLIDCDFTTPMGYFALCQEIYLVQTLDILTIQPLTAFLRDLKTNNVLEPEKVRVVINKDLKVGKLTSKIIISGMSSYNDPSMSFMTELFNKDTVNYCVIPFDERAYSRYLEGVVNCEISVSGFSSGFVNRLKTLAELIYPLTSKQAFGKNNHTIVQPAQQQHATFSNSTSNTLNKMRKGM